MDFSDMDGESYVWLVAGFVVAAVGLYLLYRAFRAFRRSERRCGFLDTVTSPACRGFLIWGLILVVISLVSIPAASDANISRKKDLAKDEARKQTEAQIREDLEGQGLLIVKLNPFPSYDSRNFVELQGSMEGCTYKYEVLQNPRGVYVLDKDSGTPYKQDPPMVFPENDGNAYTPECPPGLDLPEGGR